MLWQYRRMQQTFLAFFFVFRFSFVQNGLDFSKGCEGRKKFSNFLVFGGSKRLDSSLTGGGSTKGSKGKEDVDAVGKDDSLSLRSIFTMKRRRLIIASGVVLIALPTPGASKTGAEEGYTGEEPQGLLIFRAKATAEGCTGCSIRMYA